MTRPRSWRNNYFKQSGKEQRAEWTARQWQPTLTAHDPNPPITLEDAAGGPVINSGAWSVTAGVSVTFEGATAPVVNAAAWSVTATATFSPSSAAIAAAALQSTGAASFEAAGAATATAAMQSEAGASFTLVGGAIASAEWSAAATGLLQLEGAAIAAGALLIEASSELLFEAIEVGETRRDVSGYGTWIARAGHKQRRRRREQRDQRDLERLLAFAVNHLEQTYARAL